MPDQNSTPATKRMTTAEVAALAQDIDGRLDDLSATVTDIGTRLQDIGQAGHPEAGGASGWLTRDQLTQHVHEALVPLHDEMHELRKQTPLTPPAGNLASILARLEDAERKVAGVDTNGLVATVAQQLHPTLSELRRRLDELEHREHGHDPDPVSATLAEDHMADQIEHQVDRKLAAMFEEAGLTPARLAGLANEVDDLREYVRSLDGRVPVGAAAAVSNGAAKKVLLLMRTVTHIGKEKEAILGNKGGRFNFRGVDDAMDAVGHAMRDVGLILGTRILDRETTLTPVTQKGTDNGKAWERTVVWATSVVTAQYTFTDPDDGSTHVFEMVGEGRDSSDKSTSKATSMALKYGLFQALMIPVTGLDDADDAPPQQMVNQRAAEHATTQEAKPPQQSLISQRTEEQRALRAAEALKALGNVHRLEGGRQAQYDRLVAIMNRVNQEGLLGYGIEGSTLDQHGKAALATLQAFGDTPEYQPSADELDRAVRDLPSGTYPPNDEGGY
jgi:ERF superfamily